MRISDWSSDVCSSDLAREETGFAYPQQEAQHVEHGLRFNVAELCQRHGKGNGNRDKAPGDHDASDPEARSKAVKEQVARHFEEEIAPEENARTERVDGIAKLQIAEHIKLGEADIDPIQVRRHRSEEHTSELQSLMRISYAVFC